MPTVLVSTNLCTPTPVPRVNTPMPMNLFVTWEFESPNLRFVPRL